MGVMYGTLADSRSCSAMGEADMNRRRVVDAGIGDRKKKAQPAGVLVLHAERRFKGTAVRVCEYVRSSAYIP